MNSTSTPAHALSPAPISVYTRDDTLGAWLMGTFLGLILQGVMFTQVYRYFRLFPKDRLLFKLWVTIVTLLEMFNTALTMHSCYYYLVINYDNSAVLQRPTIWSIQVMPIPASLTGLISQLFFARRGWIVSRKSRPVIILSILCLCAAAACYISITALGFESTRPIETLKFSNFASIASSLALLSEILSTTVLIVALHRSRTGITRTDSMIDSLILYAISTGFLTCICNILNMTFSIIWPKDLMYAASGIILVKLYANTFLAALNTRQSLVERGILGIGETTPFQRTTMLHRSNFDTGISALASRRISTSQVASNPSQDSTAIELKAVPVLMQPGMDSTSEVRYKAASDIGRNSTESLGA